MNNDIFNLSGEKYLVPNARQYVVVPSLPDKLKPILTIANNFWWAWNSDAVELFRRMSREMWEEAYHNPIRMLGHISQDRLTELANDDSFLSHLDRINANLKRYLEMPTWFHSAMPEHTDCRLAYFSTEFGLHESLPIYSGGLGILSGDHLKSASDLGLPLAGVGLLYRFGYFKQYLNYDGWQQEEYNENHFFRMPLEVMRDAEGTILKLSIDLPGRKVYFRIWKVQVGRVPLYLLDTDIDENSADDRNITAELYGGDREMRIRQETLLGIGGVRALRALGIEPTVIHINEGHSAFLVLERVRMLMEELKMTFDEASCAVRSQCVFTTHTPVPAGNEVFDPDLVVKYLEPIYKKLGLKSDEFLALGRENPADQTEKFCLTVLALKMAGHANGVSRLHGTISRNMWKGLWPAVPRDEVPITSITNGIHINSWISYEMAGLFDRYLGSGWKDEAADQSIWEGIAEIPDSELWRSHERRRERLVSFARARLKNQLIRRGASRNEVDAADEVLDPEALTIGFARRFASYKRGTLIFRDLERIKSILMKKDRPVQFIIAGKAHPQDNIGKQIIKDIIHISRDPGMRSRVVFLEDYDMNLAHYLVQGTDVWLNTPRRPLEASGTSGMKAAANGVLNMSILDGWWCEAYNGHNGWIIGSGEEYSDETYQDEVESKAIYDLLEKDVVPQFYTRGTDGLPRGWIRMMKTSMRTNAPLFNTNRMVEQYVRDFYAPAGREWKHLMADNAAGARLRAAWKRTLEKNWSGIKIARVEDTLTGDVNLGSVFTVRAFIRLGDIQPENVSVQMYWGYLDSKHRMNAPVISPMNQVERMPDGTIRYEGTVTGDRVGHCGYVVRILPNDGSGPQIIPRLILWQ